MGSKGSKAKVWSEKLDKEKFEGKWYVNAVIPTPFEKKAFNPTETYTFKTGKKSGIADVLFEYNSGSVDGKKKSMKQFLYSNESDGNWSVSPTFASWLKLSYTIIDVGGSFLDEDVERYDYIVIVHKDKFAWIMSRTKTMEQERMDKSLQLISDNGFQDYAKKILYPVHK